MSARPDSVRPPDAEATLIEECRRGNRRALGRVFQAEAPALERLIARLAGPSADVEDLLQQTLLAAILAFPRFRGEAKVSTWLARIAVNVVREQLWRPRARAKRAELTLVRSDAEPIDAAPPPDQAVESRRRLERLYVHLDALGPKKRIAFILHVLEGRAVDEVAALMGATQAATKSRVFFARRALVAKLGKDPLLRDLASPKVGA